MNRSRLTILCTSETHKLNPRIQAGLAIFASVVIVGCASNGTAPVEPQTLLRSATDAPYRASSVKPGHFNLTENVSFETEALGRITLTKGFQSDGSSSIIDDVHGSRMAGMLHDALYTFSGHLRFDDYPATLYSKATADQVYCRQMSVMKVATWHRSANCSGVSVHPGINAAWARYKEKRERRWAARKPADSDNNASTQSSKDTH